MAFFQPKNFDPSLTCKFIFQDLWNWFADQRDREVSHVVVLLSLNRPVKYFATLKTTHLKNLFSCLRFE